MTLEEELVESFELFGVLSGKILEKCVEICDTYHINAEDLANQWGAYAASNSASLTLDALESMERKEYARQYNKDFSSSKHITTPTAIRVYKGDLQELDTDALVMNSYSTPKSTKITKRVRSPTEDKNSKKLPQENLNFSPSVHFSPSSYSSTTASPSANYAERTDSGSNLLSYGPQNLLQKASFKRYANEMEKLVSVNLVEVEHFLNAETRYMYEVMSTKGNTLDNMAEWLGQYLIKKHRLDDPQAPVKSSGIVTTYGRICCDGDGKLNAASVLLESTRNLGKASTILLNLNKVGGYSLFPGQTVAVQGFIPNGNVLVAQKLYTDASPNPPSSAKYRVTFKEPLHILVAAGPYTLNDNLAYQPLQDLIKYVTNNVPHVLILMGPFIDESHQNISEVAMAESFDSFFETLIGCVMTPLEGLNIQVVLLPSQKDAHHHMVYPTPPYILKKKYPNLHCVSDPSTLNIEGLIIGCTTTDILLHLGKEEICSSSQSGDRMSRLASHLISQQSFYPLFPPDEDMCVDHELLEQHAMMDIIPHILIVPSNLRYFVKQINNCTVVNPERLTKGYVGGTFCQIQVFPPIADCISKDVQDNYILYREQRRSHAAERTNFHIPLWILLFLIVFSTVFCLTVLGIVKGLMGLYCCAPVGMWGLGMLIDLPRPLDHYQEAHLAHVPVRYDETGWPVHPDTGRRSVRAITRQTEFYLNIIFFLAYPLAMGITMCSACCFQETADDKQCFRCINTIVISECGDNSKQKFIQHKCEKPRKRDIYSDGDSDEAKDTEYVVCQLQHSQHQLQSQPY